MTKRHREAINIETKYQKYDRHTVVILCMKNKITQMLNYGKIFLYIQSLIFILKVKEEIYLNNVYNIQF